MKNSVWQDSAVLPEFNQLCGDIKTDVLIIGGGLCGILCAYFMQKNGIDYALVEGGRIAGKTTGNTTAKITSLHGLIYSKLIRSYGIEKAEMYFAANQRALHEYEKICKNSGCDFEKTDAYTYSLNNRNKIEAEVWAAITLGASADFCESVLLPFETSGAVRFKNQAQFNPLKFIAGISEKLNIYENTFVYDIAPDYAVTSGGKIKANKIIVATHFPFINKHGGYFLKLYQHRSYVTAFENTPTINGMYVDENIKGMSFREYQNMLFIGGSGHRTGKQSENWTAINNFAKKYFPTAKPKYSWATQDCMSLDGIPYIGKYSASTPDLYVATGFNKWGITSSMVSAMILSDMICGRKNEFAEVFSPQRSILKPQLFVNGFESAVNLLTPIPKRCPHMGCALKWNKAEHSWDCSCHGSRFDKDGKLLDNPANGNLKNSE